MTNFSRVICVIFVLAGWGCSAPTNVVMPPAPSSQWVNDCTDWDDWDKQGPPFRIYGNSYYVGTCGITAILVVGKEGHILIDGATEAGADVIANNIEALGFALKDIKILLNTHEHFDHAAGLAKLQQLSGAKLLSSSKAAPVLRTGVIAEADPQFGMHDPFPAVNVDGILNEWEAVTLGNLSLIPIFTPGHTPGAVSWQWESCQGEDCLSLVFADSLSAVSSHEYRFSDHPIYVSFFKQSFDKLATLDCDILLSTHPSSSQMRKRLVNEGNLLRVDGCPSYAKKVSKMLMRRLDDEQK